MKDLFNHLEHRRVISPQVATDNTALVGQVIDHADYNSALYLIHTGTLADSDATFTVLLEESDDNFSTSNAVADVHLLGTEAGASFQYDDDDEVRKLGYVGTKRYTRLTITPSSNSGNAPISASVVLGNARKGPQSSQS